MSIRTTRKTTHFEKTEARLPLFVHVLSVQEDMEVRARRTSTRRIALSQGLQGRCCYENREPTVRRR